MARIRNLNGRRRQTTKKLVQRVKAVSYGHSFGIVHTGNKYAGKAYGPHRTKIAHSIKQTRAAIKARFPHSKIAKGVESANKHYLR